MISPDSFRVSRNYFQTIYLQIQIDMNSQSNTLPICEVRIPTYKRPKTLRRVLESLKDQTYPCWKAIVFDNSPEQEAKDVVSDLHDDRIIYQPHPKNIGGPKNIDLSLQAKSMLGGKYAFSIEDNNYVYPNMIKENIETLQKENINIILRNQEIRYDDDNGISQATGETTRGKWFKQGVYSPIEVHAAMFFCEGLSNGGLFWDTENIKTDFALGDFPVQDGWYQEIFRGLKVVEPIYFDARIGSVYTVIRDYKSVGRGSRLPGRLATPSKCNKATQAILRYLLDRHGSELIQKAKIIASYNDENTRILEHQLLNIMYTEHDFKHVNFINRIFLLCKHFVRAKTAGDGFQLALKACDVAQSA
ncbi:MAG: glycosyltransferase [Cyanobacteria bacterium P01_D01_bin.156]